MKGKMASKKKKKDNVVADVVATSATGYVGLQTTSAIGGMVPASAVKTSVTRSTGTGISLAVMGGTTLRGAGSVFRGLRELGGEKKRGKKWV